MKLESELQSKIIQWCKAQDILCWKIMKANEAGVPDLYMCHKGKSCWFEVKRDYNCALGPKQIKRRQELFEQKIACFNACELKDALNMLSWHFVGKGYER